MCTPKAPNVGNGITTESQRYYNGLEAKEKRICNLCLCFS